MPKSKKPRKKGTHSREVRARQSLDRDELPIAVHVLEWTDELSETERGTGGYGSTGD